MINHISWYSGRLDGWRRQEGKGEGGRQVRRSRLAVVQLVRRRFLRLSGRPSDGLSVGSEEESFIKCVPAEVHGAKTGADLAFQLPCLQLAETCEYS